MAAALLGVFALAGSNPEPEIPYFKHVREVSISAPDRQNYLVIDAAIWNHAPPDLADLRLYDGATQVPYQLTSQRAATSTQEVQAKILNLVQRGDHTEFDLDVAPITEYNRIHLAIDHKDFLATATVAGRNDLAGATSASSPTPSTLFDFSRENLGSNFTIALPVWSFRYVHVRLSPGILPKELSQASVAYLQEKKAFWTDAGTCRRNGDQKRTTVFSCEVPPAVPIDRIQFDVPANRVNFRRPVSVSNEKGVQAAAGSISRIRMNRGGTTAISEDLALNIFSNHAGRFTIAIDNGDDPPIPFDRVQPQSLERRLYFEPQGKTSLKLYYGDDKLSSPVYDYAKFFREDPNVAPARLAPETQNAAYTGRPDDRPWSEQHKAVLWAAMLLAVAVLAVLAVRGLQSEGGKS
ncbi:MAG: DUF3999 family protein [Terriglobales bacterium]